MKDSERLDRVEEELAHLRVANEELSGELLAHLRKIEALEKTIAKLESRFAGLEESVEAPIENQKPPHW